MKNHKYFFILAFSLLACGDKPGQHDDPDNPPQEKPDEPSSEYCATLRPNSEMILIETADAKFCIDRYEAYYISGQWGLAEQSSDVTAMAGDGSTTAIVGSKSGKIPVTNVSWWQALAACENSGAHLCTQKEWESACRGNNRLNYPYGNDFIEKKCNDSFYMAANSAGSDNYEPLKAGGSFNGCRTLTGVYDLSGNIEEWVNTAINSLPDSNYYDHRFVRGGSYRSNRPALQCTDTDAHHAPGEAAADRGFRCCLSVK